jgi:uncharacterized protein (DUF924 family)
MMESTMTTIPDRDLADLVAFWRAAGAASWFKPDAAFDQALTSRFLDLHGRALTADFDAAGTTPESSLGLVLVLDQLPRNMFRGTARMFASDAAARRVADTALAAGHDMLTEEALRVFYYLPFEHAEDWREQERAVTLIAPLGGEYARYAEVHRDVIRRFGRFPHRNASLGRISTPEEQAFLASGGFAG